MVDVFSFSSAVTVAVSRGAEVPPALSPEDAVARADAHREALVLPGRRRPTPEGWSHSPKSLQTLPPGARLIYFSDNGGHCCARARRAARLLVGALINASAVAAAAVDLQETLGLLVSVVACGECWSRNGALRPCLEDEMGAGAIISAMQLETSPEAGAAARTFESLRGSMIEPLRDCGSGRELRAIGFSDDVHLMAGVDTVEAVPLRGPDGWIRGCERGPG